VVVGCTPFGRGSFASSSEQKRQCSARAGVPAEWFELVGVTLDTTVELTVIIRDTEHGVSSYQLLVASFY
jgi:hypothetical protein